MLGVRWRFPILGGRKERQEILYENIGHKKKSQRDTSTFRSETNDLLTRRSYKFSFLAFFTLNVHAMAITKEEPPGPNNILILTISSTGHTIGFC